MLSVEGGFIVIFHDMDIGVYDVAIDVDQHVHNRQYRIKPFAAVHIFSVFSVVCPPFLPSQTHHWLQKGVFMFLWVFSEGGSS